MIEQRTTPNTLATSTAAPSASAGGGSVQTSSPGIGSSSDPGSDRNSGRLQSDRVIVATSEASRRSLDQATAHARSDAAVLIAGPSGSGRKHFGRAIHAWSRRAGQPLVVFPVASTPEGLHERELFGSADGSQTLSENTAGYLAAAGSGTLLIDGLDKLSPACPHGTCSGVAVGFVSSTGAN